MGEKMIGTVKWFDDKKGFGFIVGSDGSDIFVHWTGIVSEEKFKKLKEGQKVSYVLSSNEKGSVAVNVELLEEVA